MSSILDVSKMLDNYSTEVQDEIERVITEESKKAQTDLRNEKGTYQVRTGKYNNGWKVKKTKNRLYVECIVYNTHYQLTHLLENGHDWVGRNGQRKVGASKPRRHIAPVNDKAQKQVVEEIERAIGGIQ